MKSLRCARVLVFALAALLLASLAHAAELEETMQEAGKVLEDPTAAIEQIDEAATDLQEAIKENPDSPEQPSARLHLARLSTAGGRFHQAVEILDLLREREPEGISQDQVLAELVVALNGKGNYVRANELTHLLLEAEGFENDPRRPQIVYETAWHQETVVRNYQEAISLYRRLLEDHPDAEVTAKGALRAGRLLENRQKNLQEAVKTYLATAINFPDFSGDPALYTGAHSGWSAGWRALQISGVPGNNPKRRRGLADYGLQETIGQKLAEAYPERRDRIYVHLMDSARMEYGRNRIPNDRNGKKAAPQKALQWAGKALEANPESAPALRFMARNATENRAQYFLRYLEAGQPTRQELNELSRDLDSLSIAEKALEARPDNVGLLHRTVTLILDAEDAEVAEAAAHVEKLTQSKAFTTDEQQWIGEAALRYARRAQDQDLLLELTRSPRHPWAVRAEATRAAIGLLAQKQETGRIRQQLQAYVRNFADMHAGRSYSGYENVMDLWRSAASAFGEPQAAFDALQNFDDPELLPAGTPVRELLRWELGRLAYRMDDPERAGRYFSRHRKNDDLSADCWMSYFEAADEAGDAATMLKLGATVDMDLSTERWNRVRSEYIQKRLQPRLDELANADGLSSGEKDLCEILVKELQGGTFDALRGDYNQFLGDAEDSPHAAWAVMHVTRLAQNAVRKAQLPAFGGWVLTKSEQTDDEHQKALLLRRAAELFAVSEAPAAGPTIGRWSAVGPFPTPEGDPLAKTLPPEENLDTEAAYQAEDGGGELKWQQVETDGEGFLDLAPYYLRDDPVMACAAGFIDSPAEQTVLLYAGIATPAKIWLNGEEIMTVADPIKPYEPDAYMAEVTLQEGTNRLLVKSVQEKDNLTWGVSLRLGRLAKDLTARAEPDARQEQKLAPNDATELKMWEALGRAARVGTDEQKAQARFLPFDILWQWGRSTEARGGYRALRDEHPAIAQQKLAMSYYGWGDRERSARHAHLGRDRFLQEMDRYLQNHSLNARRHLIEHFIPHAGESIDQAFGHVENYLRRHPGDWPMVRSLWQQAARVEGAAQQATEQALTLAPRHAESPWIPDLAVQQFKSRNPELLKLRYEGTGVDRHRLAWVDAAYEQAGESVREKVERYQKKRQEYVQEADKHEEKATEAERLAHQKPREAENFEQKAEKAAEEGREEQADEFRAEAEKLRTEAKEHQEVAERNRNMAGKLRDAAKKYAEQAEEAQKEVGEVRTRWVESVRRALLGQMNNVTPRASQMREMIGVDREAANQVMAEADIESWAGDFHQWRKLGQEFHRWGDFQPAIKAYRRAMTLPGGHPMHYTDTCFRWAECARKSGEPEEAEKPLRLIVQRFGEIRSQGVKAEQQLCDIYRPRDGQGNRRKYVAEVHRFVRRYPDQSTAYAEMKNMQQVAQKSGDVAGVIQSLSEQISEAQSPDARRKLSLTRARTLYGSGHYYQALKSLAAFPPAHTEATILKARCAWQLLDYHSALTYLNQARENRDYGRTPATTPPLKLLMSMSQFKTSQEHYADAFGLLDEAQEVLGENITPAQETSLSIARADVLIAQGDMDSALPIIKEVQAENPGRSAYWIGEVQLGKIDFMRERYAEAVERFRKVAKLMDPQSSPRALFWIGKTQLTTEKTDAAIETFRKLWSNYGENDLIIQAIYLIGRTYRQRGDFIDAIHLFESVGVMRASNRTKIIPGEDVVLKVQDPDYAVGTGRDYMNIEVTTSSGDSEQVRLSVNPISQALFVGAVKSELGKPEPDSGMLELHGDDVVTVRYLDRFGEMTVKYRDAEIKMDRTAARQARAGHNIGTDPGTSPFSEGKVRNLERLTDGKHAEPVQGQLDALENESFIVGTRFLRSHLVKEVRIHTGERAPRKIRIEVLEPEGAAEDKQEQEWIVRKEIDDLQGAGWHEFSITPSETRAVRIRVLDHPEARGWRQINELEVIEGSARMAWDEAEIEVGEASVKQFDLYVVDTGEIEISSVGFDLEEEQEEEEGWQPLAEEQEEEVEEHALNVNVARRRAGLITPGNTVFARLKDKDLDVSEEKEQVSVKAHALGLAAEGEQIKMDTCDIVLTETEPHSGEFRGLVQTAASGPTAGAGDTAEGFSPGAAIDDDPSPETVWQARPDGQPGKWIEVDLKDLHSIGKVSWTRGEGATDGRIQSGSVTIYGGQQTRKIDFRDGTEEGGTTVQLETPVEGRYIRLTANSYEGSAPAVSQIVIEDDEGNTLVPAAVTPQEMRENDVLELNVGDSMELEYVDEENMEPGKPTRRQSNSLAVEYDTADVRVTMVRHSEDGETTEHRQTARIRAGQLFQAMVQDVDEDRDDQRQSVTVIVGSESGDSLTLEATETEGDSGTFVADVQTSDDPTAEQAPDKLYVRDGDAVWVNYVDERNMVPGHTVTRSALVFESTPTGGAMLQRDAYVKAVPDFVEESLQQTREPDEEITGPTIAFGLRDPDALVSPFSRVPVYVGARNTRARRIIGSTAADLQGSVSGVVELARQQEERSLWEEKDLAFDEPLFSGEELDTWKQRLRRVGPEQRAELLSGAPLPVLGDDVIFFQYRDRASATSRARILHIPTRRELAEKLEESERTIPPAGSEAFLQNAPVIKLQDPETAIENQEQKVREQYENLMGRRREMYEKMLEFLLGQQRELSRRLELARARAAEEAGEEEGEEEAPEAPAGPAGDEMLAAETELAQETVLTASEMLQERLKKIESDIEQTRRQVEFYERFQIPEGPPITTVPEEPETEETEETGPFFATPIPGYPFKIHVTDPDLAEQGEATVVIRSFLNGLRTRTEVTARPAEVLDPVTGESRRVMEAVVQTDEMAAEGALPVGWGGALHITYEDPVQEQPGEKLRRSFVAFASDGALGITQKNFVDAPETLRVGEALNVVVKDADRDVSFERDNVLVQATSDNGDNLVTMLSETAGRSGEFRGRIQTAPGSADPNDAMLQCSYGGRVTVGYKDYINTGADAPAGLQAEPEQTEESEEEEEEKRPSCVKISAATSERGIRQISAVASLLPGSDGEVKLFARNLKRGRLEKETLFSSGYAHYMLGKNFTELGSLNRADEVFARARDQFMELIRRYPGHEQVAHATFYLGNIQFVQENFEEAIRYYRNVLENAPKSDFIPQTRLRIGMAYEKLDKTQKAMEQYAYLTFHHKDSPYVKDAMVNLALYFDKQGREADAEGEEEARNKAFSRLVSVAERFQEKFPNDERTPRVILRAALRMVSSEHYARAAEILEKAEATHADNTRYMPAFLYWHAEALLKGKVGEEPTERARVLLQRVVYDFEDTRYQRIAKARLVEVED